MIPVKTEQFSAATPQTSAATGSELTVSFTAPAGRPTGWDDLIGLYKVGADNGTIVWRDYTRGLTSGQFKLKAPAAGTYEFRYVVGRPAVALSAPITVR
jgi:hypothetical protein